METKPDETPFCYVAEARGRCFGFCAGDFGMKRFAKKYAGYTIKALATEADWQTYYKTMLFGPEPPVEHDLVASLEALLQLHVAHHNEPAHSAARAALAKARGEQP